MQTLSIQQIIFWSNGDIMKFKNEIKKIIPLGFFIGVLGYLAVWSLAKMIQLSAVAALENYTTFQQYAIIFTFAIILLTVLGYSMTSIFKRIK